MVFRILVLCLISSLAMAAKPVVKKITKWTIDSDHSSVNFKVKHMGISTVRGSFRGVTGDVTVDENNILNTSVNAKIDINSIDTGVAKRDGHLKADDFFDVPKFPVATFISTKVVRAKDGKLSMTGKLTLKDKTKEVTLQVSDPLKPVKNMSGNLITGISATTTINRQDFGLNWSKFVEGISAVGDEVKIEIELELMQK